MDRPGTRVPLGRRNAELAEVLDRYLTRYANDLTRSQNRSRLNQLFRDTGKRHPDEIATEDLFAWVTGAIANNSVRQRLGTVRTFFAWSLRTGLIDTDPTVELQGIQKQYPRTYGKVQAKNPARWLDRSQAFGQLLAATHDGTDVGLRDEIGIHFGLCGLRAAEVVGLTWGNLHPGEIRWIGKGRKPRRITPGKSLVTALSEYRTRYGAAFDRDVTNADPILCPEVSGAGRQGGPHRLAWGRALAVSTYFQMVQKRGHQAGLGHIAPHDLRRTAAGILHQAKGADGGHLFDLLDIQRVLGHSDPATTMRSYLNPMDHGVTDRAAEVLDYPT